MKIKRLFINNFKSLVNFELIEPNPFSVFVGPNAAGKSNILEALEFFNLREVPGFENLFGGINAISNVNKPLIPIEVIIQLDKSDFPLHIKVTPRDRNTDGVFYQMDAYTQEQVNIRGVEDLRKQSPYFEQFIFNFSRLFIGRNELVKMKTNGNQRLRIDADNLERVLWRLLQVSTKQDEIIEWLQLLVPELEKVDVAKSELSGDYYLRIFERHLDEPIGKNLISDGTYNILALLTAVYQSDEPQFLCIEEPENGLNPYVIRTMVDFFRNACNEKGHYIWLNTHSATLVRELRNEEIILIDKVEGITQAKRVPSDFNRYDLTMDEAWLTNALGGGLPW